MHFFSAYAKYQYRYLYSESVVNTQAESMEITQNANLKCILAICALTLAFMKVSIRVCGVYGTYCMSLGSFYAPRERITVHLSEGKIIFCSVAVFTIYWTMGLWKF